MTKILSPSEVWNLALKTLAASADHFGSLVVWFPSLAVAKGGRGSHNEFHIGISGRGINLCLDVKGSMVRAPPFPGGGRMETTSVAAVEVVPSVVFMRGLLQLNFCMTATTPGAGATTRNS